MTTPDHHCDLKQNAFPRFEKGILLLQVQVKTRCLDDLVTGIATTDAGEIRDEEAVAVASVSNLQLVATPMAIYTLSGKTRAFYLFVVRRCGWQNSPR